MAKAVDIKLFGPWSKVMELVSNLKPNIQKIAISTQRSIAEKVVRRVKAHLKNQDIPGWTPLSPKYADYKMGKYGHEDILIATGLYYDSIKTWRNNNVYHAGVPKGETYGTGVQVSRVAAIHEAWSKISGKPHRPLWSYTINEDMGGLKGIREMAHDLMAQKLKAKGYPVKKNNIF